MHLPVKLVFIEEQPDRTSAMLREIQIKTWTHQRKHKLIYSSSSIKEESDLSTLEIK
jgi:predicted GIY-YIG superfamily endonuclease